LVLRIHTSPQRKQGNGWVPDGNLLIELQTDTTHSLALFDVAPFIQARGASKGIAGSLTATYWLYCQQTRLTRWRFELVFSTVKRRT
jgi:hypothetical protein